METEDTECDVTLGSTKGRVVQPVQAEEAVREVVTATTSYKVLPLNAAPNAVVNYRKYGKIDGSELPQQRQGGKSLVPAGSEMYVELHEGKPTPGFFSRPPQVHKSANQFRYEVVPPEPVNTPSALNVSLRHDALKDLEIVPQSFLSQYQRGMVAWGTDNAVSTLLDDVKYLTDGVHGIFISDSLCPSPDGRYEEGENFEKIRLLGTGGCGTVDLCQDKAKRRCHVQKTLPSIDGFQRDEVDNLLQLKHENIAQFMGFILRNNRPEIFLEYAGLSLNRLVSNKAKWNSLSTEYNVARLSLQGLEALDYIHKKGLLHLDIKPENICVAEETLMLKLTDFGSCRRIQDPLSFAGWTPEYMSPEACQLYLLHQQRIPVSPGTLTNKTDVFAFGMTVAFMRYGINPIMAVFLAHKTLEQYMKERMQIILQIATKPELMNGLAQQIPTLSENERLLLAMLLQGDVDRRSSARDAVNFIQNDVIPKLRPAQQTVCKPLPTVVYQDTTMVADIDMQDDDFPEIDLKAAKKTRLAASGMADAIQEESQDATNGMQQNASTEESSPYPMSPSATDAVAFSSRPSEVFSSTRHVANPQKVFGALEGNVPRPLLSRHQSGKEIRQRLSMKIRSDRSCPYNRSISISPVYSPDLPDFHQLI